MTDANSNVLFTSTPVMVSVGVTSTLTNVDLGTFDTAGFANGQDLITVTVVDQSSQPLPQAAGTTFVQIGLPVSATLSVSPTIVPTGTVTVTNTLTINPSPGGGGTLSLLGQVADTGTPEAVAVDGTMAYVPGTQAIDIVDVSNPASPQVVGTFGQNDLAQGGTDLARIVGNNLVVATEQPGIDIYQFTLLIYSLTNPLSPQLLGSKAFSISYLNDMEVEGNTVYFSSSIGYFTYTNGLVGQGGNLTAIDMQQSQHSRPSRRVEHRRHRLACDFVDVRSRRRRRQQPGDLRAKLDLDRRSGIRPDTHDGRGPATRRQYSETGGNDGVSLAGQPGRRRHGTGYSRHGVRDRRRAGWKLRCWCPEARKASMRATTTTATSR